MTEEAWMVDDGGHLKGHPEIIQVMGDFGESNGLKHFEPFG